ncbi:MAG: hypothetical protein ORN56_01580, partial [Chitinophagales bacterium]|nr:hypothetical protein [Chitinophagales bacterium]
MKKYLNSLSLCAVMALVLVLASCGGSSGPMYGSLAGGHMAVMPTEKHGTYQVVGMSTAPASKASSEKAEPATKSKPANNTKAKPASTTTKTTAPAKEESDEDEEDN